MDGFWRGVRSPVGQILSHGGGKEKGLLWHHRHAATEILEREITHIDTIKPHLAG
jgi:hypothetical protein